MISSRKKKRWIVPKGVIEPELSARASAVKEALEEAGVEGFVSGRPIGSYRYKKWGGACAVQVYAMMVETEHERWEESHRERQWVSLEEAIGRTEESDLKELMRVLPDFVADSGVSPKA